MNNFIDKITGFAQSVFKKDFVVGLDIGTGSIKIAQFAQKEEGLHLVRAGLKEIKQGDNDAQNAEEMASALRHLFADIDIKRSRIIVNINCPQTLINKITAPYMPRAELYDGIRLEAKNYFPFAIDQSMLDFEILGDIVERGVRKYEVIVAVSPVKTIDKYLSLLGKAGIKPAALVPSVYALQKLAEHARIPEGETWCFLDIGELHTELIICKGKSLLFSRKIPVAGRDFTKAMTGVLISDRGRIQLSWEEAEKIKRQTGIPEAGESRIIEDKISTTQILAMLRTPIEQLTSEIERCFDYYREETGGGKIDAVVLLGAGASLAGLIKSLSEGLGIRVMLGDPLEGLIAEKDAVPERDKIAHQLGLAIGAALSAPGGINLLPPEIKEKTKRVVRRGTLEAVSTAVILILILLYAGMKIKLSNFQKRIAVGRLELSSLEPQLKTARIQTFADKLLAQEPYWEDIFKELSNLMPGEVYLTNISMRDNIITMKGIVNAKKDEEKIVSNFILVLERGLFNNVHLVGTRDLGTNAGTEFELRCGVDYE